MPTPVPTPTEAELVTVAEIMMIDANNVLAYLASDSQLIANAKWALTLADVATWATLADEANDIKRVGSIEFFENTIFSSRLAFRNKLRLRYGLAFLSDETGGECDLVSSLAWF